MLSILVLQHEVFGIFEKQKKNVRPDWVPLSTVKFSAQTDEICGFAGGETFCKFLTLGSLEVHEDDVWQICVYDNFCSTTRGLSTLKISGIFAGPFPRNAGKGGGVPLRDFSCFGNIFFKNS